MKARFRLIELFLATLAALNAGIAVWGMVRDPYAVNAWASASAFVLFAGAWMACRRGHLVRAAWSAAVFGSLGTLALLVFAGDTAPYLVLYLPVCAVALWTWAGKSETLAFSVVAALTLVLGGPWGPSQDRVDDITAYVVSMILASAMLTAAMLDLRRAVSASTQEATRAELAAREAQASDAARQRFLGLVSHRLRDPLDVVCGYAALLREEEDEPERIDDLDRIAGAARQLVELVQDLMDMSRVEDEELPVVCMGVNLTRLVADVAEVALPLCKTSVTLHVELPESAVMVWADEVRLRQIVTNLTVNALKYTERGSVSVRVVERSDAVGVEVVDTGIGIPADRIDELFEPFVQLHEGTERRPGVGLGLALAQRLAARMGGQIRAESALGVGSTFRLWLPPAAAGSARDGALNLPDDEAA